VQSSNVSMCPLTPSTPRLHRERGRCAAATLLALCARWRGLGTCTPSEVVRNDFTPRSMPTTEPVRSSGSVGTSSQESSTYQRWLSRLTEIVLTRPRTSGCWWTRMCPTPCRYNRYSPTVESHRQPSRSEGHSTVSNQPAPLNRGNPESARLGHVGRTRQTPDLADGGWLAERRTTSGPVRPDRLGGCREAKRTARRSAPRPDASARHRAAPAGRRCTALGGHRASRPARPTGGRSAAAGI
jgi:hypothetical protein